MNLDALLIDKLAVARAMLMRAANAANEPDSFGPAQGVSHAQDALELILRSIADHFRVPLGRQVQFEDLIRELSKAEVEGARLVIPHQPRLSEINKVRVNFKHYGIIPDPSRARELAVFAQTAADDICKSCLRLSLWEITSVKLVRRTRVRNYLSSALDHKENGNFEQSCIDSGIAFALTFGDIERSRYRRSTQLGRHIEQCGTGGLLSDRPERSVGELTRAVQNDFKELAAELEELRRQLDTLKAGISVGGLAILEDALPSISVFRGKGRVSVFRNGPARAYTIDDATWIFDFVLDAILRGQGAEHPQPPEWVKRYVRVVNATPIYAYFPGFPGREASDVEVICSAAPGDELPLLRNENLGDQFAEVWFEGGESYIAARDVEIRQAQGG